MAWSNGASRTSSTEWRRLRRWAQLNLPNKCNVEECEAEDGLELDHIIPVFRGGEATRENVQWLCSPHHKKKTASESYQARGGAYKRKPKPSIGSISRASRSK